MSGKWHADGTAMVAVWPVLSTNQDTSDMLHIATWHAAEGGCKLTTVVLWTVARLAHPYVHAADRLTA